MFDKDWIYTTSLNSLYGPRYNNQISNLLSKADGDISSSGRSREEQQESSSETGDDTHPGRIRVTSDSGVVTVDNVVTIDHDYEPDILVCLFNETYGMKTPIFKWS